LQYVKIASIVLKKQVEYDSSVCFLLNLNITDAVFWDVASCTQVTEILERLAVSPLPLPLPPQNGRGGTTGSFPIQYFPNFAAGGALGIFVFISAVL
jgi:hypothetical protein